jgi:DNA topoisomerase-6 subunit B
MTQTTLGEPMAVEMAKQQRQISVAEFFEKNRHLLGFDNPKKALLTTVKEAVDNSLDACEEAGILPEIKVDVFDMEEDRYRVRIEDNGPGIVKKHIPKVFASLLYGSKFHKLQQSRGQQGIGISASVMYAQLTTGRPVKIKSKIGPDEQAYYFELKIDTEKNKPEIVTEETIEWDKDHGLQIELDLEGTYRKGKRSIDEYIKQTSIVNPHVTLIYTNPRSEQLIFTRAAEQLPREPKEIKPHPDGVELGLLTKMLERTNTRTLTGFLQEEFTRVGRGTAEDICENATLRSDRVPSRMKRKHAEQLLKGIQQTDIMNPPTDCISPIGEELLEKGMRKEVNAEFYCTVTRKPEVYRGYPFQIEVGIAYGGEQSKDSTVNVLRYANRVPLLYQKGACAFTQTAGDVNWKTYGLDQSGNNVPRGPATIVVHMASPWVPFTSESKEAIAHYDEILDEVKLAMQQAGRKLQKYTKKKTRIKKEKKKRNMIEQYLPHVAVGLKELLDLTSAEEKEIVEKLEAVLQEDRGELEDIEFDPDANPEYDEEFAKIGREDDESD